MNYQQLVSMLERMREYTGVSPGTALSLVMGPRGGFGNAAADIATSGDVLNNFKPSGSFAGPVATPTTDQAPFTPNARVAQGFSMFPNGDMPILAGNNTPSPLDGSPSAAPATPVVSPGTPMPTARPSEAPTPAPTPDLNWFQRNAYLQTDPVSGAFLDPSLAAQAQATTGPNLIKKFMGYLQNKDIG